jgi:hypothetical protein
MNVRDSKIQAVEGEAPKRVAVIAFDSAEKARVGVFARL